MNKWVIYENRIVIQWGENHVKIQTVIFLLRNLLFSHVRIYVKLNDLNPLDFYNVNSMESRMKSLELKWRPNF